MKTVATVVKNNINNDHINEVKVVVRAEWNQNAMYRTAVDNDPLEFDEGFDTELYPIESIVFPMRPEKAGICKAVVGQATAGYESYTDVPAARYYVSSVDDEYKYWQSPVVSAVTTGAMTKCSPYVTYLNEDKTVRTIKANKIHILIERTFSVPTAYEIQVKTNTGGVWTKVADQTTAPVNSLGVIDLWYNSSAWTATPNYANVTDLHGVRLVVTTMSVPETYFNLIEMGARLELDVSNDVTVQNSTMSLAEADFITPLGTIAANTGGVTLFNETRTYSNNNVNSILYDIMDKGVKFTAGYTYKVSGTDYYIQDSVMYSDTWDETESETSVTLVDYTRFFQDTKPRRVLYQNMNVYEIVWRLCDILGFNSYKVITSTSSTPPGKISYFWTDSEKTLWETLQELSKATQTAIYFDAYGQLCIRGRESAFDKTAAPVGVLTRNGDGTQLANIVSLTDTKQYEANKVKINYSPAKFEEQDYYVIPNQKVWEPEGTLVLRASELTSDLAIDQMTVFMQPKDAETWPYKGSFNIQGEFINYEGKEYTYLVGGATGTQTTGIVKNLEDQQKFDRLTEPPFISRNSYTGKLILTERGVRNTEAKAHPVKPTTWRQHRTKNYGVAKTSGGVQYNRAESCVTLSNTGTTHDYLYLNRGLAASPGFGYFGTSIRIDKGTQANKIGGIFFNSSGSLDGGYFVEVAASITFKGKKRQTSNEIAVYSMKADGSKKVFGGETLVVKDKGRDTNGDRPGGRKNTVTKSNIGARAAIVMEAWNEIDVIYYPGVNDEIIVSLNGTPIISAVIPDGSGWKRSATGLWGLYARGQSKVSYDYAYAVRDFDPIVTGGVTWYDRISGGFRANQGMLDIVYGSRQVWANRRKTRKKAQAFERRFFDEFGPILHEIREFEAEFEGDTPVVESKLYISNLEQCIPLNYSADNGTAKFTLANTSRNNAVLSGDDTLTTAGIGSINQRIFIYGRQIQLTEDQSIEKKDDFAINRRGIIETDYESPWIQSKEEAEKFGIWLVDNFRTSDSIVTVEAFGNPLYELSDVVTVNYLDTIGSYYVTEIGQSFEGGLTTSYALRKQ